MNIFIADGNLVVEPEDAEERKLLRAWFNTIPVRFDSVLMRATRSVSELNVFSGRRDVEPK